MFGTGITLVTLRFALPLRLRAEVSTAGSHMGQQWWSGQVSLMDTVGRAGEEPGTANSPQQRLTFFLCLYIAEERGILILSEAFNGIQLC